MGINFALSSPKKENTDRKNELQQVLI